mgnify:CR=1 FL=1
MRPEFIPVGQIVNAHGIRGEVKPVSYTHLTLPTNSLV